MALANHVNAGGTGIAGVRDAINCWVTNEEGGQIGQTALWVRYVTQNLLARLRARPATAPITTQKKKVART